MVESARMIGEKTAKRLMACGWIAAGFGALGGIYISLASSTINYLVLAEALFFLGLAYGIYRASRICALLALALFLIDRVGMYRVAAAVQSVRGGNIMAGFWPAAVFFSLLYLLGAIGTFAWHAREPRGAGGA
jgi:hypothetical protein